MNFKEEYRLKPSNWVMLHDRFLFVDRNAGYFSGASFKDGAKNSPALIYQVTDVFSPVLNGYEQIWKAADVVTI